MSDVSLVFNPFEDGFAENPYPQLRALREGDPVHQSPLGLWMLFRYEDVRATLRNPAVSMDERNAHPTPLMELSQEVGERVAGQNLLDLDPPAHTRLRRLVSKAFTPRMIEQLRGRTIELVDAALDRAAAAGGMELMDELAFQLPFTIITELLGMPATDTVELRRLSGTLVRSLEPVVDPEVMAAIAAAAEGMRQLVSDAIEWKRSRPADDLLSALIAAEEQGDMLSDEELMQQVILLYIAGHETTVNLIGNGTLALLRNPSQYALLRSDPSLVVNAVEEFLRYDPPVQMSRRITLSSLTVGGKTIEPGAFVMLGLASAGRDPLKWGPTADSVDIRRHDAGEHVSFGGGHHHCLGAALARLEGQVALGRLATRFASISLAEEPTYNGRLNLRGLSRLPVSVSG